MWDAGTGDLKMTLDSKAEGYSTAGCMLSPDGRFIVSWTLEGGTTPGKVLVWHMDTGTLKMTLEGQTSGVTLVGPRTPTRTPIRPIGPRLYLYPDLTRVGTPFLRRKIGLFLVPGWPGFQGTAPSPQPALLAQKKKALITFQKSLLESYPLCSVT